MRWLITALAVLFIGCARPGGELVAFPQSTDPTDAPPANTDDPNAGAPTVLRTRFPAHASTAQINRTACTLKPMLVVGGAEQKVDMRIGGVTPCSSGGTLRVNVFVEVTADGRGREIVLELPVPTGATTQDTNELKLGLREVRAELEHRIASLPPDVFVADAPEATKPDELPTKHRRSQRVLVVAASLLISGGAVGAASAVMVGAGASNSRGGDFGLLFGGFSLFVFGSAPALLAGIVTIITAGALYAGDD